MDICDICKSIKFDQLPSEEEPAIPHQPDIDSLRESIGNCPICRVIFLAAGKLSTIIHNERTGNGENVGGRVEYQTVLKRLPGQSASPYLKYVTHYGYYDPDDDGWYGGGPPGYAGPVYTDPTEIFPDSNIRPWLFGSWWTLPTTESKPQLIGLGVRLGAGPNIEDAVGNSENKVHLRGTSFRFRTEHGMPTVLFRCQY
jgi:hypothetical protein